MAFITQINMEIIIKDNGKSRAIPFHRIFKSVGVKLPTFVERESPFIVTACMEDNCTCERSKDINK